MNLTGTLLPSVAVAALPEDLAPTIAAEQAPSSRSFLTTLRVYFMLTKPRVIELLLVTTVPAMVIAAGKLPGLGLIGAVLLGGALSAGGANTINCWIEQINTLCWLRGALTVRHFDGTGVAIPRLTK